MYSVPGLHVAAEPPRPELHIAGRLKASTRHRPFRIEPEAASRAILGALASTRKDEQLVLQIVLGPRRVPLAIPTNSPSSLTQPWFAIAWHGNGKQLDGDKRSALRDKVSDHGFACTIRLGAAALHPDRARALLRELFAAVRTVEGAGVRLRLRKELASHLNEVRTPWLWPLRTNVLETLTLTAGRLETPTTPAYLHSIPRPLRPAPNVKGHGRVLAEATAPGVHHKLGLSMRDALQHSHYIGVTGAGKSTLMLNMITQDMASGCGLVVIDPKGDLVEATLARVPSKRKRDVVVLDPLDRNCPIGLNPLMPLAGDSELAADGILAVFKGLYPDAWGPRIQDVMHASLLTLARRRDASLVMLPLLLSNDGFRRSITSSIDDPIALGAFWEWFEGLSPAERQQASAPVLSRMRKLLMRPSMRAVLGKVQPRFDISQVFSEQKILLVPLSKGLLGPESAGLLGSLVVSRLWQTILTRTTETQARRKPVSVYVDEVQDYLHLETDIAEVFAQSRSYGTAWTVAHQYLNQLPPLVRSGLMANARSRVIFNVSDEDARVFARGVPQLQPEDFSSLGAFGVYASLLTDNQKTPYASGKSLPPSPPISNAEEIRELSREKFGRPLTEIEGSFAELMQVQPSSNLGRRPRRQP